MAPIRIRAQANAKVFICDLCSSTLHPLRTLHPRAAGFFSNSSAADSHSAPSLTARSLRSTSKRALVPRTSRPLQSFHSRRRYTTEFSTAPHPSLASRGLAPLPHRRLISLYGPDAAKFLQGLVTNNVDTSRTSPFYCAFLNARGRVLWDAFIWVFPEVEWACYIEIDAEEVDSLLKHLKRHKLRSKITITPVPENEVGVWAAWGFEENQLGDPSLVASLPDPRAPGFGVRCLFQGNQDLSGEKSNPPFPILDTEQYHIRRYLHGIPEGPKEIQRETALPMEFNFDLSDGIDFRKGCYVGQELTIRTKHTGVVRKRILPVQLYREGNSISADDTVPTFDPTWTTAETLEPGLDIKPLPAYGDPKRTRATGKFIAGIGNVGLALCRLEMMTDMRITNEGGSYKPGTEFRVQSSEGNEDPVRVKAVVPLWLRERERAAWNKGRRATRAEEVDGV